MNPYFWSFHFFPHTHHTTYSGMHWLLVTTQKNERKVRKSLRKRRKTCVTIIAPYGAVVCAATHTHTHTHKDACVTHTLQPASQRVPLPLPCVRQMVQKHGVTQVKLFTNLITNRKSGLPRVHSHHRYHPVYSRVACPRTLFPRG